MDKAYEMHLNVNRARIVGETLTYLNDRLKIMKDLTRDEAYYVTATAFRTHAFDEQDWNALKEKDEFFPNFLKDVKGLPYKAAIKKISDELYDKSNPNREKEEEAKKEAEKKAQEKAEKEKDSIFEEEQEQDEHNARAGTSHAGDINNARMNGGKAITFHIPQDPHVEERVLNLVHSGRIDEAHLEIYGFIEECLEGQLSQEDFVKAHQPGDTKINKPVQMNAIGISQTLHIKNKSLIDALTCAHLGLVMVKKLELDKKMEADKMREHKLEHLSHAMDELIINEDIKGAKEALEMSEEECKAAVEAELCDVCDHLEKDRVQDALNSAVIPHAMPPKDAKKEDALAGMKTAAAPGNNPTEPVSDLTDQDKKEIADFGLKVNTHAEMEAFRRSAEYEMLQSMGMGKSLDLPD